MNQIYRQALEKLRQITKQTSLYAQFNNLALALQENLTQEELFGSAEQSRRERFQIIYRLDQLSITHGLSVTFSDLCMPNDGHIEKVSTMHAQGKGSVVMPQQAQMQWIGTGKRWAVVVGINNYIDDQSYGNLQVCVQDATALSQQLCKSDFKAENIRLLTNSMIPHQQPLRENIFQALDLLAGMTKPNDLLLFYFSGHGLVENGESYLVPRNGRRFLKSTEIKVSEIKEIMLAAQAKAKVIILDACHSGANIQAKGKPFMSEEFIKDVYLDAEGLAIISSCQQGQLSYEWPEMGSSVFTYFLLEALRGKADNDQRGFITVHNVNSYVTHKVKQWAMQREVSQDPRLHYVVTGDIILAKYRPAIDKMPQSTAEEANSDDILKQYIGDIDAWRDGSLHQKLTEQLAAEGIIEMHKKKSQPPEEDVMNRYHAVPLHAALLYTAEDKKISKYLTDYWSELHELTGNVCDLYPIVDQFKYPQDDNAYTFMNKLGVLRKSHFTAYGQLPVLFFWDNQDRSAYISFGHNPTMNSIKQLVRQLFDELHRTPTIGTVSDRKEKLGQMDNTTPQTASATQPKAQHREHDRYKKLDRILVEAASEEDLIEICIELGFDQGRLQGPSHVARKHSLASSMSRQKRLDDLEQVLNKIFPNYFTVL